MTKTCRVAGRITAFAALLALMFHLAGAAQPDSFRFVILGDRTGEAEPGVYEQVLANALAAKPAFLLSVGDTIQGLNDSTAEREWQQWNRLLPGRLPPLYLTPGNHDIWSPLSERLFRREAGHPPHYSFDYAGAHFTILDNSRSEQLSPDETRFLEQDLAAHAMQPLKFVISHRPSWLLDAAFANTDSAFHKLLREYSVRYVLAGHIHQMLHIDVDGVSYTSAPSSGGHLRASGRYEDGWFFGYLVADVHGVDIRITVHELAPPRGQARITELQDWGKLGLVGR